MDGTADSSSEEPSFLYGLGHPMIMPHRIEVFSANCPLCKSVVDEIEAGRCAGCKLTVYDLSENLELARNYGITVVPTVIIDGEVKIEGRPDIPFVCSDETYAHFKQRYPMTIKLETSVRQRQWNFTADAELTEPLGLTLIRP